MQEDFKSMKHLRLALLFLLIASSHVYAEENYSWPPDQFVLQYAGEIGFLSVGVNEKYWKNTLNHELLFGYVPQQLAGQRSIYTIANKLSYLQKTRSQFVQLYVGANIFYVLNVAENTLKESYYRHNEYPINSLHLMPYAGLNFLFLDSHSSNMTPCFEIGILDDNFDNYILNRKTVSLKTIFTFSLGLRWNLNYPN